MCSKRNSYSSTNVSRHSSSVCVSNCWHSFPYCKEKFWDFSHFPTFSEGVYCRRGSSHFCLAIVDSYLKTIQIKTNICIENYTNIQIFITLCISNKYNTNWYLYQQLLKKLTFKHSVHLCLYLYL